MISNVSHEYRTPLNAIIFGNEFIERKLGEIESHHPTLPACITEKFEKI